MRERKIRIDPSPVTLLAPLSGAYGSTAPATENGVTVTAVLWPSTYTFGTVAAGMPCSPTAQPTGASLTKRIQAISTYRRCF